MLFVNGGLSGWIEEPLYERIQLQETELRVHIALRYGSIWHVLQIVDEMYPTCNLLGAMVACDCAFFCNEISMLWVAYSSRVHFQVERNTELSFGAKSNGYSTSVPRFSQI